MTSILVLDSGVGGLSVCESILQLRPDIELIYVADDAYFPYGLQDEEVLQARLLSLIEDMLGRYQPSLVVLACNTVSTLLLPILRERFSLPFVGVVPAIKPAAECSNTKHIALVATPATVRRRYTDELIDEFAKECLVTRIGSAELVKESERVLAGYAPDKDKIQAELALINASFQSDRPIDSVVLGCTHFPLIKNEIAELFPDISLIDSGSAIARRVEHLLSEKRLSEKRLSEKRLSEKTLSKNTEPSPKTNSEEQLHSGVAELTDIEQVVEHKIYFSKAVPHEEGFHLALKKMGISPYRVQSLSAMSD